MTQVPVGESYILKRFDVVSGVGAYTAKGEINGDLASLERPCVCSHV